ncbi:MAG: hypothetical protein LBE86_01275 [Gemmobacter sp.]|nr:hypothetical protein [Gemmobacter sp.]
MRRFLISIAGCGLLAACVPVVTPGPAPIVPDMRPRCGAERLQWMVGQTESAMTGINHQGPLRVLRPGSLATMDFQPDRLNVSINTAGRITEVTCG